MSSSRQLRKIIIHTIVVAMHLTYSTSKELFVGGITVIFFYKDKIGQLKKSQLEYFSLVLLVFIQWSMLGRIILVNLCV